MDIFNINGLPLHVLLVHLVVVLVPVTALGVVLVAVWPEVRRRFGIVVALLGLVVIGLVPLTGTAGQWLKDRVFGTPLIETHAAAGNALWQWSLALGLLAIGTWLWYFLTETRARAETPPETPPSEGRRAVGVILAILALGIGGMATYQTVVAGESGSRAVWEGTFSDTPGG